ncbi:MAG TPA: CPBP family intramembrane metalloprotease [Acidimicrobiales bacterium]|nr:CPBP family intramembrane metalloprotease [Acidimicrobiales bacterium]
MAALTGFLLGQVLATLLEAAGAALARYPGGLSALARSTAPPWWATSLGLVGLWVGFGLAVLVAYRAGGLAPWPSQWRARWGDLVYVPLGVACQFAVDALYALLHPHGVSAPAHRLFDSTSGLTFALVGTLSVLGAPVFEEWLFRGVLYRALAEGARARFSRRASVALGAVGSALLFGLAHAELVQLAGLVGLGVVLALLAERSRRLVPSWVTHASFNATAFAALFFQRVH